MKIILSFKIQSTKNKNFLKKMMKNNHLTWLLRQRQLKVKVKAQSALKNKNLKI